MFKTNPVFLAELLENIDKGKIQLPDFQRGWVWDDYRIRSLLASISRGFPAGAVLTLAAQGNIGFKSRLIEGVPDQGAEPTEFLLDGQQRLTSLYQAMRHPVPVETMDVRNKKIKRRYYVDINAALDPSVDREDAMVSLPEDRIRRRNFGRDIDLDLSTPEREYENHMMPTEQLLEGDWLWEYHDFWKGDNRNRTTEFRKQVLPNFAEYRFPVINLNGDTPSEAVCIVFEKVNTGGISLSMFELVTATMAAQKAGFSLRDDWAERRKRLHQYAVLQGIEGDQFLQAVSLLVTLAKHKQALAENPPPERPVAVSCKRRDILRLHVNEYLQWADRIEAGFEKAAQFLRRQYVFRQRDIPYSTQLVPLAALYVELGRDLEPIPAFDRLERWYWSGIFSEVYGSAVETRYAQDLIEVAKWIRGGPEPQMVTEAYFAPERLLSLRTRTSAAYKGLYALQMKNQAADWRTGKPLEYATWEDCRIDIHHIFPRVWCQKAHPSIPNKIADSIINKTPVDAGTNRKIGGRAPSRYYASLQEQMQSQDRLDRILSSHWVDPSHLQADDFRGFFMQRGMRMLALIGQAMGKEAASGSEAFRKALNDIGYEDEYID